MCVCIIFSLNDIIYIYIYIYDFIYERNNNNCLILEYILSFFFFFLRSNARIHTSICKYLISAYHCVGYGLVVYNFSNIVVYIFLRN